MDTTLHNAQKTLLDHELYETIQTLADLRVFMAAHVFAVWDFMSLVKRLQLELTSVAVPWQPPADREAARLINEIVLGEESDLDVEGKAASHLEMYLDAMTEIEADTRPFRRFLDAVSTSDTIAEALDTAQVKPHVATFVSDNIELAQRGSVEEVASSFLYGREDAIPEMFTRLLERWGIEEGRVPRLTHYLKRHIEVDGDSHGPAAQRILDRMVKKDKRKQKRVSRAAHDAIGARVALWDGIVADVKAERG